MHKRKAAVFALIAAGTIGFTAAPHAQADMGGPASLVLSVEKDSTKSPAEQVTLTCYPSGGSHSHPDSACASLDEVKGKFAELPASNKACTLEYDPVTVQATGQWRGKPVDYTEAFANPCLAIEETDGVFDL